jgi:cephalosporin-C deacetylase-like acetyl esterase
VSLQNIGNARVYGILSVPRNPGKYPAILQVPGAGIRPYQPDPELIDKDLIVLSIGIHGIPVNLDPSVYKDLENGALKGYFFFNNHHRDRFYYKRVYAGCVRAVDFIFSLPAFDGVNLGVSGNSQGGALSIVTAALDPRVKCIGVIHPALCDLTGYLYGRAGGWPHVFSPASAWYADQPEVRTAMAYYDVVNFARQLRQPGWYTWGYNDESCPPTSMHAAYNAINASKQLALYPETGHWFYPEQRSRMNAWLLENLK